ncbi:EscR/YscR/HrcR family type III secretion system export apparatus protein [Burkholderia ambifaria]|jgi:type III secretion protein R|uniref:EscR/YscR/HrcR family type III secretion system export apparatus protein n=1 Tax=Burkholderia ambifaria TaxID=152480 RepID=UPI00158EF29A|nr:EscR/YscR/HrcR family type III secretion system export apparatus protein [Burkholderia ambifaria]
MDNHIALIGLLGFASLLPFVLAAGTCYLKFSIVFVIVRNAIGLQQVPSNLVLNAIALMMSIFVMMPVGKAIYDHQLDNPVDFSNRESVQQFVDGGLDSYRQYLQRYSEPELTAFFQKIQVDRSVGDDHADEADDAEPAIAALLPAYALSEIKSAFKIGFYIYLPFIIVDLVVSSVLLALGMMMMSPVVISVPIKLILFVSLDGWSILSKGLVKQYLELGVT